MPAAAECKAGISAHPRKVFVQRTIQADAELGESLKEASAHEQSRSQLDKPCCQEHVASLTVKALQRALRLRRLRPQGDKEAALRGFEDQAHGSVEAGQTLGSFEQCARLYSGRLGCWISVFFGRNCYSNCSFLRVLPGCRGGGSHTGQLERTEML